MSAGPVHAAHALPPRGAVRRRARRALDRAADAALDIRSLALGTGRALDAAASFDRPLRVTVLAVYAADGAEAVAAAAAELRRSHHDVTVLLGAMGDAARPAAPDTVAERLEGGKLQNLNRLLELSDAQDADWTLLMDDDVGLPRRFLDRALHLAEAQKLDLCQPALRRSSHTAYEVVRRRACLVRRTRFVEGGPLVMMRRPVLRALSPFPDSGMGWGVDLHWAAVARREGWRVAVIDATPIRHDRRPTVSAYRHADAVEEAERFLAGHDHLTWREAEVVLGSTDEVD